MAEGSQARYVSKPLVLIAEDDEDILMLVTERLIRDGFEVVSACSGEEALAAVQIRRPRAVVMDITLPGMNGLEVVRRIRADETLNGTCILLLTAHAQEADVRRGYEAGADAYVIKPFSPTALSTQMRAMLD